MSSQEHVALRPPAVELRFVGGHLAGRRLGLRGPDPVPIGKGPTALVRLPGHGVSRTHGWLHFSSDGTIVFEDCSDQGTEINGRSLRISRSYCGCRWCGCGVCQEEFDGRSLHCPQ